MDAPLTHKQVIEAIGQMKSHCDLLMVRYEMVSARSALYTLGYTSDQADAVITYLAANGFNYCLDPMIPSSSGVGGDGGQTYPSDDVCYWGPDQLRSRLEFVR